MQVLVLYLIIIRVINLFFPQVVKQTSDPLILLCNSQKALVLILQAFSNFLAYIFPVLPLPLGFRAFLFLLVHFSSENWLFRCNILGLLVGLLIWKCLFDLKVLGCDFLAFFFCDSWEDALLFEAYLFFYFLCDRLLDSLAGLVDAGV